MAETPQTIIDQAQKSVQNHLEQLRQENIAKLRREMEQKIKRLQKQLEEIPNKIEQTRTDSEQAISAKEKEPIEVNITEESMQKLLKLIERYKNDESIGLVIGRNGYGWTVFIVPNESYIDEKEKRISKDELAGIAKEANGKECEAKGFESGQCNAGDLAARELYNQAGDLNRQINKAGYAILAIRDFGDENLPKRFTAQELTEIMISMEIKQ
jgi:hypothetical protein